MCFTIVLNALKYDDAWNDPIALTMWEVQGKNESRANGNRAMNIFIAVSGVKGKIGNARVSCCLLDTPGNLKVVLNMT